MISMGYYLAGNISVMSDENFKLLKGFYGCDFDLRQWKKYFSGPNEKKSVSLKKMARHKKNLLALENAVVECSFKKKRDMSSDAGYFKIVKTRKLVPFPDSMILTGTQRTIKLLISRYESSSRRKEKARLKRLIISIEYFQFYKRKEMFMHVCEITANLKNESSSHDYFSRYKKANNQQKKYRKCMNNLWRDINKEADGLVVKERSEKKVCFGIEGQ